VIDDGRPIFEQVAELLERQILDGSLAEEAQVPSTNELAAFHRINPATAAKGINALVADQILYKKRGIGMFVSTGARDKLRTRRREEFARAYLEPLLAQAERLGIDQEHLVVMIKEGRRP
jgi:DNA-binding transcriptional regulator YhcF (GntR family)